MKKIVPEVLKFYSQKMREPELSELDLSDEDISTETWCVFVTLYIDGEVFWSAGNIKEIEENINIEIIKASIQALQEWSKTQKITLEQQEKINFQIDIILERTMISLSDITWLDPSKVGLIAIERSYKNLWVILPNMSWKIITWDDLVWVMKNKLWLKKLDDKNCIFYSIQTRRETNY